MLLIFSFVFAVRQDEKVVDVLRESLEKSDNVTKGMVRYFETAMIRYVNVFFFPKVTILESFANRLQKMDQTIQPLYRQTLKLTRLQTSILS